jgi:hypothetical protein
VRHQKVQCMCQHGGAQCTKMCSSLGLTLTATGALICAACHTVHASGSISCVCDCDGCTTMRVDGSTAASTAPDTPAPASWSQEPDVSKQKIIIPTSIDAVQQATVAPPPTIMTRCVCRLSGTRCGYAALPRTQLCTDCRFTSPLSPAERTHCACDCFSCTEGLEDAEATMSPRLAQRLEVKRTQCHVESHLAYILEPARVQQPRAGINETSVVNFRKAVETVKKALHITEDTDPPEPPINDVQSFGPWNEWLEEQVTDQVLADALKKNGEKAHGNKTTMIGNLLLIATNRSALRSSFAA